MEIVFKDYVITDCKSKMQIDIIFKLLNDTYWAKNWSKETIKTAMNNSICFGVFLQNKQIAFARCVTDFSTMYWLCDVVVDKEYRNNGIGNALIEAITKHENLCSLIGILSSNHSKELYKKYGFRLSTNGFMIKSNRKMID